MSRSIVVLHVDDEPDFADLTASFLERTADGVEVLTETTVADGLARLDSESVDCVVSDFDMPGEDGLDFLRRVREEHGDLPFILFTGKGSEAVARDALRAGATDYLQKRTGTEQYELLANRVRNAVEKHRSEQQRRRNERRFKAVFEDPEMLVALLDTDGTLLRANRTAMEFVEVDHDEVVGRAFWETPWWTDEMRADVKEWVERAARGEYIEYEDDRIRPEGRPRSAHGTIRPVTDEDGTVVSLIVSTRDTTERKERERELERKNEQLEQFASVVSHDLRGPLNVLRGWIELAEQSGDPEQFERCYRTIDRMEAIAEDLLALARQGERTGDLEPVDLSRTARQCWRAVESSGATLRVETDLTVRAERGPLKQLLENLFRNSVEHGSTGDRPEAGGVRITVGALRDGQGFYVADDGPGIPEDRRADVFEFGHSTTEGGTGFGLAIVDQIAAAHGWDVTVTDGEDGGARFEISGVSTPDD